MLILSGEDIDKTIHASIKNPQPVEALGSFVVYIQYSQCTFYERSSETMTPSSLYRDTLSIRAPPISKGLEHVDLYWRKSATISLHFLEFSFILRFREYLFTVDAMIGK